MRKYNISYINAAAGAPLKSGSVEHLQLAHQETMAADIINQIGIEYDATKVYRLYGAQLTSGSGDYYTTSEGAVFYNGEVFLVDTVGGAGTNMPDYIGMTISVSQYTTNADPVQFSDLTTHNIHDIRKMIYCNNATPPVINVPYDYITNYPYTYNAGNLNQADDIQYGVTLDGNTITFEKDKIITFNGGGTTSNTVTLNPTNAKQGAKVKVVAGLYEGSTVTYNASGGASVTVNGDSFVGSDQQYVANITYTGTLTNTFVVENITSYGISTITPSYIGTYTSWTASNDAITITKEGNRVFMAGRMNNTSGLSYGTGITQSFITLPVGYRPTKTLRKVLCGTGDIGLSTYQLMMCNVYSTTGVIELIGPFTNNTAFFKLEFDIRN